METLKLPKDVIDSEWRDDVDTNNNYIDFIAYKNEKKYVSPKKVDEQAIEKIKKIKRGATILGIFRKDEQLAA
ncbi:hypothetical protein IJJ49_01140 [Candidatus Saccharibacteria bacterium]|nr:hypothetical protein [Candidatus Saccharibacteria bacterium]